ncbi:ADOP family duplicated permease [Frateuria sp. STR12]|uniref:ADOP family duplicated permease n=1 Tax=Frateuria hangzhouensis TaxID=2995589 RepID=UPI002260E7DE|nr:ADOP family duplicated permease [Frateuria sp. STR12]MCX7513966.1 ADOP family duplicated permease [Frateuria sp. STR12]
MNIWLAEILQAWRASLRKPGFLLLASGVLALGIGASVAVFALIQHTLLRPLPVPQPDRLVVVGKLWEGRVGGVSPHEFQQLDALKGVVSLALEQVGMSANIAGDGQPEQVSLVRADRQLLPTLGLRPVLGRNFTAQEDRPGGPKAALLSHGLWLRRYGGDASVIGRRMQVEGTPTTIVGVLPASFDVVNRFDMFAGGSGIVVPMALPAVSHDYNQNAHLAIARLAEGTRVAEVAAQADARERAMYRDMAMGGDWKQPWYGAGSLTEMQHRTARPVLLVFVASAVLVLLIALVNLTNLMLLRALSRNHDGAVRSALGAPVLRLMLPALGEGLLVGVFGALAGIALGAAGLSVLQSLIPAQWLHGDTVRPGLAAWGFAFAMGLLGALLAALLALWRSRGRVTVDELREGGRSGIGVRSGRLGRVLVMAQVALAAILLCAAGVFMRALHDASQTPLGFASGHILTFELSPVKGDHPDAGSMHDLSRRLVERLRRIPGVTDTAVTTNLPASDAAFGQFQNEALTPDGKEMHVQLHGVGPGFFELFSIALHAGRDFTRNDVRGAEFVAIVSKDLAATYYGGHAIGKPLRVEGNGDETWSARIVGVAGETRQLGPLQPRQPVIYLPLDQMPEPILQIFHSLEPLRFALRGRGSAADWRAGIREAVAEIAPNQPIANVRSMDSIVRQTTQSARLGLLLIGLFASLALLLAAAGLYAVMAVAVAAREREFGVRLAMGAQPARLVRLVLRGGLVQIALGLAIGVAAALGLVHALSMMLVGMLGRGSAFDPWGMLGVCVVLAAAGLLACLLPAWRASRVPPMRALRGE